jgi:tetratricopeptide (TPR) repeat protein
VALSLDVALSEGQHEALARRPTQNLAAYDAFLRGELAYRHQRWREAASAYEQAVTLDPDFALACAHLSRTHSAWYEHSPTPSGARRAREAAERAVALAPDRASGYEARAHYYAMELDNARGLAEIERAERLAPRDVEVLNRKARLERNLGRWDESRRISEQAKQLDPRSISTTRDLTLTLNALRLYPEARAEGDRALAIDPSDVSALTYQRKLVEIYVLVGENERALELLEPLLEIPHGFSPGRLRIDPTFAPLRGNPRFDRLVGGEP